MAYENDVLTRNDNDELAVRVVQSTEATNNSSYNDVLTYDTNGKLAVRVVGAGGDAHNKGYFATQSALETAYPTAEAGDYAIVGSTDTVWIWDEDTSAWVDTDTKGQVTSVNGQTGAVTVQETLVSGTNIKTVNGNSVLGSGNLELSTYLTYPAGWTTNSTTKAFCDDVAADSSAVKGKAYLGEVTFSDLPESMANGEVVVEIMSGTTAQNKVIVLTLTSGNTAPYMWKYTYWDGGSDVSGWIGFQEQLISGTNIKTINNESILGSGNLTIGGDFVPQLSTMPTASAGNVGNIVQFKGTTTETYTNGYFYQSQATYSDPTATISQTVGSGLTDLAVDVETFATQETASGNYDFVASVGADSVSPTVFENIGADSATFTFDSSTFLAAVKNAMPSVDFSQVALLQVETYTGTEWWVYAYDENNSELGAASTFFAQLESDYGLTVSGTFTFNSNVSLNMYYTAGQVTWEKDSETVDIADYGITYSGTPADGDTLTVVYTAPTITGYAWNQKDVQPAGNGGGQEIEYSDIIYDPQTDTDVPLAWVAEFENLPTGDYYFYVKTAKYTSTQGGDYPIWQTNKICFHWDSTWSGNNNIYDFVKTITIAPVLDGDFVGDVTHNTLLNIGDSPVFVYYKSSGNKYALSVYNTALVETLSGNMYYGVGGVVYKVSKLYGGVAPLDITLGKKYVYNYSLSGYDYYSYGGNMNSILPQPDPVMSKCTSQQYTVSNFTETYRVFEIQSTMYPTGSRISSIRINAKCSGGELDAYVYFRYGMATYQVIKKATGVFANSRLYKRESYDLIYVSLDNSAFALLPDQSETVYTFCAIFGTGSETEPRITLNEVDVSISGFSMLDYDKSGLRLAMDLPTVETYGGVVQYVGETDANYTKGYFYKAAGTVVTVPESMTVTNESPNDFTVSITNVAGFITALASYWGVETAYVRSRMQEYSNYEITYDADNSTIIEFQWVDTLNTSDPNVLQYLSVSTTGTYSGSLYVTFNGTYAPAHTEIQNAHWEQINVQPSGSPTTATVTLAVNDWSSNTQTVNVTGVTANNLVQVAPAPSSNSDYVSGGVLCTAQGAGTLTFTCTATPTNAITVNVVIFG